MGERVSLVTGGAGFIGQHLVRQLLERGERVRILDIAEPETLGSDVETVKGSILDAEVVARALKGADRLYHLAANPNLWTRRKADFEETNLRGTRTVLAQAARAELERIVHCSTESILKSVRRGTSEATADESVNVNLDDMAGPYCRSKYLAEEEAQRAAARGLPVVIVNPTLPIGPGDRFLTPPTRMLLLFLNGRSPAYLDCEVNLIDVREAALGHILAADKGIVGERYVLGGENMRLRDVLRLLEELTGLSMPRTSIPYWTALAVSAVSEFVSDYVSGRPPIAPLTGVRLARTPMVFDCSKAVRELGLPQRPVRGRSPRQSCGCRTRGSCAAVPDPTRARRSKPPGNNDPSNYRGDFCHQPGVP